MSMVNDSASARRFTLCEPRKVLFYDSEGNLFVRRNAHITYSLGEVVLVRQSKDIFQLFIPRQKSLYQIGLLPASAHKAEYYPIREIMLSGPPPTECSKYKEGVYFTSLKHIKYKDTWYIEQRSLKFDDKHGIVRGATGDTIAKSKSTTGSVAVKVVRGQFLVRMGRGISAWVELALK